MAHKTNKELAEEFVSKGIRLAQRGNEQEAIAQFNNAIRRNPSSSRAYLSRGRAYRKLGEDKKAFDDYSTARDQIEKGKDDNKDLIAEIDMEYKIEIRKQEQITEALKKALEELQEEQRKRS